MRFVRKRDGSLQRFDPLRIRAAIKKAFRATGINEDSQPKKITEQVIFKLHLKYGIEGTVDLEEIQNTVEKTLMEAKHFDVAKAYILYRKQREDTRKLGFLLESGDMVDSYISRSDWAIKENANMSFSLQGLNFYLTSKVVSSFWLQRVYPKEIRRAHIEGDLHIHNLPILAPYCVGWDLPSLLLKGFSGAPGKIRSRPPRHFRTALLQIVNFLYTLQGEAAGAQAFSNFDTYLAPFIRSDRIKYPEIKQALQEFLFNMNIATRVGSQTPFSNLTFDLKIPSFMKNEPVILGGKILNESYESYQDEMDLLNRAFVELMIEGDADGRILSFPIPTYNITKDFNWDFPELWKMTAKYGIPYFANFINSDMSPDDVRSMCCRLRIDNRELKKRGGGLFGSNPLTGSIGVCTLNMPRIGYTSKTESEFMEKTERLMEIARSSFIIKRKVLEDLTNKGLYPYSKFWLKEIKDRDGKYWNNHFSTIGLIGMNEACLNFLGESIETENGLNFSIRVLNFMRDKLKEFQEHDGILYNLEATPAESTSYSLAKIDKKRFPNIIVANENHLKEGADPFYTNSSQLPVDTSFGLFDALRHQDQLQTLYTGGTVFHELIGERNPSPEGIKKLVMRTAKYFHIPYFTITPTFSVCPQHGYISGEFHECPDCGRKCEVYSRIVGYFRPVDSWNKGKKSEFKIRKLFGSKI